MKKLKSFLDILLRIAAVFLLLVLATWLYGSTYDNQYNNNFLHQNPTQATYDVVAFGDSLVEGLGSPELGGFVSILEDRLGIKILNTGVRRDTTVDLLQRVQEDVLVYEPQVVILVIGGNDIMHGILKETVFKNLDRLFALFAENNVTVIYGEPSFSNFILEDYSQKVRMIAERYDNVIYVEGLLQGFFFDPRKKFDILHPNIQGYTIMADRIEGTVRQVINLYE